MEPTLLRDEELAGSLAATFGGRAVWHKVHRQTIGGAPFVEVSAVISVSGAELYYANYGRGAQSGDSEDANDAAFLKGWVTGSTIRMDPDAIAALDRARWGAIR